MAPAEGCFFDPSFPESGHSIKGRVLKAPDVWDIRCRRHSKGLQRNQKINPASTNPPSR
jgi:hypothetical protein